VVGQLVSRCIEIEIMRTTDEIICHCVNGVTNAPAMSYAISYRRGNSINHFVVP
jgi:hypothetical protein